MIVYRFSGMVWRILRRECRLSEDAAADVFQDIFLALQKNNFRPFRKWQGRAPLDSYMVVVVRRLARDSLRAGRGRDHPPWARPGTSRVPPILAAPSPGTLKAIQRSIEASLKVFNIVFSIGCTTPIP